MTGSIGRVVVDLLKSCSRAASVDPLKSTARADMMKDSYEEPYALGVL